MTIVGGLHRLLEREPWYRRIAYALLALIAVLYVVTQIAMVVLWFAGEMQLDTL